MWRGLGLSGRAHRTKRGVQEVSRGAGTHWSLLKQRGDGQEVSRGLGLSGRSHNKERRPGGVAVLPTFQRAKITDPSHLRLKCF